ncbi:MAG: transposase [Candidatus Brocadiaceae bacterium]
MTYDPDKHHRRSIRLKGYDYSRAGAYYVTICTQDRKCFLGNVGDEIVELSPIGKIVDGFWLEIPKHFQNVRLDAFVVMPNHIHGIIFIDDNCRGGVTPPLRRPTLGQIVAYYKYQTSKIINQMHNTIGMSVWQRNYYEHVIRDENELNKIRQYIINNPLQWEFDKENPNIKE